MIRDARTRAGHGTTKIGGETTARGRARTEDENQDHLATATTEADETEADHATDHTEIETEIASGTETEMHIEGRIEQSMEEGEIEPEAEAESAIPEVCFLHRAHTFLAYDLQISHRRATTDHTVAQGLDRLFAMAKQHRAEDAPHLHPHVQITTDHLTRIEIETRSSLSRSTRSPR